MRALVTGATGCVGANIVAALLSRGHEVRALRRSASRLDALAGLAPELVVGELLDRDSLREAMRGCDWVFHAAAVSQYWRNTAELIYRVNVEGTRNVLRAAREVGVRRVIFTSSVAALGLPSQPRQLVDETVTFNLRPGRFPYGQSKVLAEEAVQEAVTAGLDAVILNPVSVIGERDINFVGGELLRVAQRGWLPFAPPGGTGFVSARAVGVGHVLAAERGRTGERYILNGENLTYRALLEIIAAQVQRRAPLGVLPRPLVHLGAGAVDIWNRWRAQPPLVTGEQLRLSALPLYFDGSKAERELGLPRVGVREAVAAAWSWYQAAGML